MLFFETCSTCFSLHISILGCLSCFWALRILQSPSFFFQKYAMFFLFLSVTPIISFGLLIVIVFNMAVLFWLLVRYILLSFCAAKDMHFSALLVLNILPLTGFQTILHVHINYCLLCFFKHLVRESRNTRLWAIAFIKCLLSVKLIFPYHILIVL